MTAQLVTMHNKIKITSRNMLTLFNFIKLKNLKTEHDLNFVSMKSSAPDVLPHLDPCINDGQFNLPAQCQFTKYGPPMPKSIECAQTDHLRCTTPPFCANSVFPDQNLTHPCFKSNLVSTRPNTHAQSQSLRQLIIPARCQISQPANLGSNPENMTPALRSPRT